MAEDLERRLREEREKMWADISDPVTIVDRLRGIYRKRITDGLGPVETSEEPHNPDYFVRTYKTPPIQAAAAAEIERLRDSLSTSRARVDALEKALKPFAAAAETYDPPEGDDQQLLWGPDFITIGMLRDARAALSRQEEGNG